jgi:hypothetical protein
LAEIEQLKGVRVQSQGRDAIQFNVWSIQYEFSQSAQPLYEVQVRIIETKIATCSHEGIKLWHLFGV